MTRRQFIRSVSIASAGAPLVPLTSEAWVPELIAVLGIAMFTTIVVVNLVNLTHRVAAPAQQPQLPTDDFTPPIVIPMSPVVGGLPLVAFDSGASASVMDVSGSNQSMPDFTAAKSFISLQLDHRDCMPDCPETKERVDIWVSSTQYVAMFRGKAFVGSVVGVPPTFWIEMKDEGDRKVEQYFRTESAQ